MKTYTIGEIFRLGLLKNHEGEPYRQKATVSRVVSRMKYKIVETPWGPAKAVSLSEIERQNSGQGRKRSKGE